MTLLDGSALSKKIEARLKIESDALKQKGVIPGLAVILVGDDPASSIYVKKKVEACQRVGIYSMKHEMPKEIQEENIIQIIHMLNANPNADGILVQLPLPSHIDATKVIEAIDPKKDVDGFHPYNVGRNAIGLDAFVPATPLGVMQLLEEYGIELQGKNCVVVGASNIVGKPLSYLLLNKNATVEVCHIYTKNLKEHTSKADILFVGVGKPNLITEDMVKDGAIIIDIGINRLESGKLVGDADFEALSKKCSFITPVPGGVGPMTISALLSNTLTAAKKRVS